MPSKTEVLVRAPAKVNLSLKVGPVRPDGYHDLVTVFHAVSLFDEIRATPADGFTVEVHGEQADTVPADESNLAVRAARALARHAGVETGVHLSITKGIPVAGGMAGGSADAAAALVAADSLWGTRHTRAQLSALAADVGSDVPFSLSGGTAIGTGRGERLSPVLVGPDLHWVMALSTGQLSTPAVFRELDRMREGEDADVPCITTELLTELTAVDHTRLGGLLENDLQPAAVSLMPELQATLDLGLESGALGGVVSGSGPTTAFLVRDADHARMIARVLEGSDNVRAVTRCRGPVPGARVIEPVTHRG